MNSFYSSEELQSLGFKYIGENVLISRKASIYGASNIEIGSNVRIDDFCILSGCIKLHNYIHVAAYSALYGDQLGIEIWDYANVSSKVTIYAVSDDYSGESMTNPMVAEQYKNLQRGKVVLGRHVIIGSGCVVLPGVTINEGVAVGAMSLVNYSLDGWTIYAGIPCKSIKPRKRELLEFEKQMKEGK